MISTLILLLLLMISIVIAAPLSSYNVWLVSLGASMLVLSFTGLVWMVQLWGLPSFLHYSEVLSFSSFSSLFGSWGDLEVMTDPLSLSMILLTALLTPVCLIVSMSAVKTMMKEFCVLLFFTHLVLVIVFSVTDLILFYVFFESTLIPLFVMIGVWGGSQEKVSAAFYFFLFTLAGSVFMLLSILKLYGLTGSFNSLMLANLELPTHWQWWIAAGIVLGMAVKMPMFPAHIWLPQAHVEAPVAGSVLLAGIMLKLGGYGLMKFCWTLVPVGVSFLSPFLITLSVMAVLYGGLITCSQSDMKRLVAYSSVAHMGLVTAAIFSGDPVAQMGAMFMMMSHGVVSSALFISVTQLYVSTGTSLISYYSGAVVSMPLFSVLFVCLNLANMALPLSANFLAELMSIVGIMSEIPLITPSMVLGVVMSALYSLFMVNSMCFGVPSSLVLFTSDLSSIEFYPVALLVMITYQLGVQPNWILSPLQSYSLL